MLAEIFMVRLEATGPVSQEKSCPKHWFFFPAQTCLPRDREGRREIDVRVLGCDVRLAQGSTDHE